MKPTITWVGEAVGEWVGDVRGLHPFSLQFDGSMALVREVGTLNMNFHTERNRRSGNSTIKEALRSGLRSDELYCHVSGSCACANGQCRSDIHL